MTNPFRLLLSNWLWKLAALGVACVIFFGVRRSVSYTQTLALTIGAETEEGTQAFAGFSPGVVNVTFRGSEAAIRQLSFPGAEQPKIKAYLRQPPPGESSALVRLSPRDVKRDDGLRVLSIAPREVLARFDSRDTRTLDILEPIVTGAPADGTVIVSIEPKEVEVTGSRMRLDELVSAQTCLATAILDVSNRSEGFQTTLKVLPPDARGGWTLTPDTVQADVRFVREDIARTFAKVPVRVLQSTSGERYRPDQRIAEVTVYGSRREVEAIPADGVRVFVDEPEVVVSGDDGGLVCEPQVVLPCTNRVNRIEVKPKEIRLTPVSLPTKEVLL